MKVTQRLQAFSASHAFSMNKKLDTYLSEHLPDLMDEYKIADRSDTQGIDQEFEKYEARMQELEHWRTEFSGRIDTNRKKLDRLKTKYGSE